MATSTTTKRRPTANARSLSQAPRVERFFARHLRHTKGRWGGRPLMLEEWQRAEMIEPIFGNVDPKTGLRNVREALIGIARKNAKSTTSAGIGLYGTFADGYVDPKTGAWVPEWGAEVYSLAGSRPQARIVFGTGRDMVLASPYLRAASKIYKDAIEVPETGAVWRVLSADARLAHGYNPSMAIIDELHVHPNGDLYEAMLTGTAARAQPLVLAITTAGWDRNSFCYQLYERGRKARTKRFYFRWWQAPEGCAIDDPKAWRAANPGSWVTQAFLRDQLRAPGMHPSAFRRLHLNQWTGADERWIPADLWDACSAKPKITPGSAIYVGVDAAPKRDTTAVAIVHRDDNGVHHVVVRVWEADRKMGILDFAAVEDFLRQLAVDYDVRRIVVDPYIMMRSLVTLAEEGLPVEDFPQNDTRMVPASQNLYDLVLEERLRHGGDRTLTEHSENAVVRETSRGWRLHKLRRGGGPNDAIIAVAMACRIAEQDATDPAPEPGVRFLEL